MISGLLQLQMTSWNIFQRFFATTGYHCHGLEEVGMGSPGAAQLSTWLISCYSTLPFHLLERWQKRWTIVVDKIPWKTVGPMSTFSRDFCPPLVHPFHSICDVPLHRKHLQMPFVFRATPAFRGWDVCEVPLSLSKYIIYRNLAPNERRVLYVCVVYCVCVFLFSLSLR